MIFPRSEAEYADAEEMLDIILVDRSTYGFVDFFTGATQGAQA